MQFSLVFVFAFLIFFSIFSIYLAPSGAKYCEKGAVNQSAASAASLDCEKGALNFGNACLLAPEGTKNQHFIGF